MSNKSNENLHHCFIESVILLPGMYGILLHDSNTHNVEMHYFCVGKIGQEKSFPLTSKLEKEVNILKVHLYSIL